MKVFFRFLKENIVGMVTAAALAVIVFAFTHYNLWILLGGFIAGYFVVGIVIEFLVLFFESATVRRESDEKKVEPDKKAGIALLNVRNVHFLTGGDLSGDGDDDEDGEEEERLDRE